MILKIIQDPELPHFYDVFLVTDDSWKPVGVMGHPLGTGKQQFEIVIEEEALFEAEVLRTLLEA